MNSILDDSLVGLALLVSAGYALSSLGPKSLRRRLLAGLSRMAGRAPAFLGLRRASQWLAVASAGKAHGACGGCDSCGTGEGTAQKSTQNSRPDEVKVRLAQIGRRT
jgi:hypothetical protein